MELFMAILPLSCAEFFFGSIQKSVGSEKIRYLTEKIGGVKPEDSRPSEGRVMVYLMRSISFLNCLMPQDKGGELWKMTKQRSHSF